MSHPVSEERTHQGRKEGYSWVVSSGDGVVGGRTRIVSSTVFLSKSELGRWGGRTNSVEQAKRIYCISVRSKQSKEGLTSDELLWHQPQTKRREGSKQPQEQKCMQCLFML